MKKKRTKVFGELNEALRDALAYERGEQVDLRTTNIPAPAKRMRPRDIKRIRLGLKASQPVFARLLNVSTNTVESWEQGVRQPRQAALKLLTIAARNPRALLEA